MSRMVPGRSDDSGMTLVELLVAMIIFGVAMSMILTATILAVQVKEEVLQSASAVTQLRQSLQVIDRQVRSGNVLFNPGAETVPNTCTGSVATRSGTCMRIYTQADGVPLCFQWQVVDQGVGKSILRSRSWAPGGTSSAWATVATGLTVNGNPFMLEGAATPYSERLVRVNLLAYDERQGKDVAVDSSLTGRNTTYGFDAGQCTPVPPPL
jgi:prepilin-type N-terminal cleavage/methylation domain-containing protein